MIFTSTFGNIVGIVLALATTFILYFKWKQSYWARKGVPYFEPSVPFGTSGNPFKRKVNFGIQVKNFYDQAKANGWKHVGLYSMASPNYLITDLELVRNVLTKDFQHFVDRGVYINEKDDPLSGHLFNIAGQKWRNMRTRLSPTFTSGKMKMMFHALIECVPSFLQKIEEEAESHAPIDVKEALGRFTTDIIGSCAFGLECKTFEDENSPFRMYGKKFFSFDKSRLLLIMLCNNFPNFSKFLGLSTTPKDLSEFFIKLVDDTVSYREKNNQTRNDFLQLLIDLKNNKLEDFNDGTTLNMGELAAQCFVFFVAGFETSSTTMAFALYELSKRPDLQRRVQEEIKTVLQNYDDKITYDAIQEMKILDRVINETLRMYPPVPVLFRTCVKDYKVPGQDVVIEKGVRVTVSALGIHYDKDYWDEPEKFDPDRFTEENKSKRHNYAHLPFGEGPRNCIGMRFGLMQSKVGLACLIQNYQWSVSQRTIQPLRLKVQSFIPTAEGEIWLNAEKINK